MPKEMEGISGGERVRLRSWSNREAAPFDVGGLEKETLAYTSPWMNLESQEHSGYGLMYRIAAKEGVVDDEGDETLVLFHVSLPYCPRGTQMPETVLRELMGKMEQYLQESAMEFKEAFGLPVTSINADPPAWMMEELQEALGPKGRILR